ncbi:PLP-dependent aminotransferase family protein [Aneurinibacillus tyrosinisolvens]|uniref:MocR-like pyridoxine biosynthesis transcription factor PdxR n=1 Tax=Aneurinibacillus tyrosinisolvens TaxID=1443435 RepID=UPI00063F52C4|nr:PLP-dependent aminotransferase family protein [Aneurinibacillus tyrosinisolvens]
MDIDIERNSGIPLAEQVSQAIAAQIRSGAITKGSKLPSVRKLSDMASVSFVTAVQAYELLEKEGLITRIQGKGTYVKEEVFIEEQEFPESETDGATEWQQSVVDYVPGTAFWRQHQHRSSLPLHGVGLSVSAIDQTLLPVEELAKGIQELIRREPAILAESGGIQGDEELRDVIADYLLEEEKKPAVSSGEVLITSGIQQAIDLVARTFVGPGDVVAMESPTYAGAIDIFRARGAVIIPIPVDEDGMRVDVLASFCHTRPPKVIYTMPSCHNPTGVTMSSERRAQLLRIACDYNSITVEDDTLGNNYLGDSSFPALKNSDEDGRVIYLKDFSEMLPSACKMTAILASGTFLSRLAGTKAIADPGSPILMQKAVLSFFKSGRFTKHKSKLNLVLRERRDMAIDLLRKNAPSGVRWIVPNGGFNIWLTLPPWMNTDMLLMEGQRHGVTFLPGSTCYPAEPEYHHLRISFSHVPKDELERGIKTLCKLLASALHSRSYFPGSSMRNL